jgi:hypothetical protein
LPTAIFAREAPCAYVAFSFRLAEIYVPFVRHTERRFGKAISLRNSIRSVEWHYFAREGNGEVDLKDVAQKWVHKLIKS